MYFETIFTRCRCSKESCPARRRRQAPTLQADPDGTTVYDPIAQVTWLADANLAAQPNVWCRGHQPRRLDGSLDGTPLGQGYESSDGGHGYLGRTDWDLPETGPPDPSCSMKGITGFGCTGSAMGLLFYDSLASLPATPSSRHHR